MRKMLGTLFLQQHQPIQAAVYSWHKIIAALRTFAKGFIYGFRLKARIALEMMSDEGGCLRISRSGRPLF